MPNGREAYAEHHGIWKTRFAAKLAREGHAPDIAWEPGVLDLVAPLDVHVRDALKKAGCGLPWGGRGDLELYWRIMYAAYAEHHALLTQGGSGPSEEIRPIRDVALAYPSAVRAEILQDVVVYAGHQLKLRGGLRQRPQPLTPFSTIAVSGAAAHIDGYGFDGTVFASRETKPDGDGAIEWRLDTRDGRWRVGVMPWQFTVPQQILVR